MAAKVQDILQMYGSLVAQRDPWLHSWQMIANVALPAFNDITTQRTPGLLRTQQLLDSTGLHGCIELANHLMGIVSNFQTQWFTLRMRAEPLNRIKPITAWLDRCAKMLQDEMAATTTPQSFHEMYLQLVGMGTSALFTDPSPLPGLDGSHPLLSRSLPIATYVIAENVEGLVDTVYRELELSPRQAVQHFGYAALHPAVQQRAQSAEARHQPSAYLHAVYPRRERNPSSDASTDMAYASCYIDVANHHLVDEGGYRWNPYTVTRWQKLRAWSPYGFGPGHMALPDMLTLNAMMGDFLRGLRSLTPGGQSYWTDDPDAAGRVSLLPGSINPIARGATLQPMVTSHAGAFDVVRFGFEDTRTRIRKTFYVDDLRSIGPVDEPGDMTAYEVSVRVAKTMRIMGPVLMRLLNEFLNPFIDIRFGTMLEADAFPPPPDELLEAALQGYGQMTVEYQGPLARAQRSEEIDGYGLLMGLAERYTTSTGDVRIWNNLNMDEMVRRASEIWGVQMVVRDAAEKAAIDQQQAEAAQAAQEAAEGREDAKAIGAAAPMVKALTPQTGGQAA